MPRRRVVVGEETWFVLVLVRDGDLALFNSRRV